MKVFIVLAVCFVSCASAGHLGGYGAAGYAAAPAISTGSSSQFREEDTYGNYKFGYDESHASGRTGRREEKNGDIVTGSYNLYDADGRDRTVHYVADHQGFRATIHTNEPGVDASRDPAAVLINKEGYAAVPAPEPVLLAGPAYKAGPAYGPAPAPLPLPLPAAGPAFNKGYGGAPLALAAPLPAPAYAAPAPARREAFTYSFGTSHPAYAAPAPVYAAPAPAPILAAPAPILAAPAPIRQLGLKY